MKLPDFRFHHGLNAVREAMGAYEILDISTAVVQKRLHESDFRTRVRRREGVEIRNLADLDVLSDNTLVKDGVRVLLHIRDVPSHSYRRYRSLPKFHVTNCETLQEMRRKNRSERYVIAADDSGQFLINIVGNGSIDESSYRSLDVCQFCLGQLRFEGFSHELSREARADVVGSFTLKKFFNLWPRDLVGPDGHQLSSTAPLNEYAGNFGLHAQAAKDRAGWRCEIADCGVDLSAPSLRRYLHAHHRNHVKYDNRPENLQALCIACHAEQPLHAHIKSLPEHRTFVGLVRSRHR
jgi:hypothetical protein